MLEIFRYPKRVLQPLLVGYTEEERAIHKKLDDYCASREQYAAREGDAFGTAFTNRLLKKRLFSSPAAFDSTLEKHIASLSGAGNRQRRDTMAERILYKAILKVEEDYANDEDYETAQAEAVEEASRRAPELTPEQRRSLDELRTWSQRAKNQADSKAKAVLAWCQAHLKTNGDWSDNRVILFTEYRTTHQWLHEILASHGFGGERLEILHGGMDHDERERIKAAFQTSPRDSAVRILLATDAASEGIDLQNHCHCLIHLEIPYNPNVMEQRNGRIDRHGQRHKEVSIWHPVDGGNGEDKVGGHAEDIIRALRKLESMRADMGSVNPVIAPQMAGLIEGSAEELDTRMAEAKIASARKFVKAERQLEERIAKLHERLLETRHDFHLTPQHIEMAVKTGLKLAGKPPLEPIDLVSAPVGTVFKMPALAGTWARCLEGLRHPHTQVTRPITFDHAVANGRDDVVLIHLNHRLVQMCLRLLRAEIWAQDDVKKLHRVTVRSVSEPEFSEIAVVVISRLVITGGNHHRLHEELTYAGGYLREQGYKREEGVKRIEGWLEQAQQSMVNEAVLELLRSRFERSENALLQTVDARSKDRLKHLINTLNTRKAQEIEDITNVLSELEKAIQAELHKDEQPQQFDLFSDDEKTQLKRDLGALRARLDGIPQERQREIQAIEARYADFTDRTFPVAVVFLVPAAMSDGGRA